MRGTIYFDSISKSLSNQVWKYEIISRVDRISWSTLQIKSPHQNENKFHISAHSCIILHIIIIIINRRRHICHELIDTTGWH